MSLDQNVLNDTNLIHTFIIYYRKDVNRYFIRTYKEKDSANQLVLIKLGNSHYIKKKAIIKIGDLYFQLLTSGETLEVIKLDTKSRSDKDNDKKSFHASKDPIVTIGRNKKCTLPFVDEKSFSRVQTTIQYINGKWEVRDGGEKPSTNGTW